eukprot:GFUD01032877.1.p1 GENE.GFUD01032877.1~~GFUD01032877.1.p1  ORF type:complete len:274 (-),score=27.02 GFUD01032877.1:33-854(-)
MNLVIKFPLLLMFGLSNPYNPHPLYPQHFPATQVRDSPQKSPDDWWYSMGDDWEVSKKLKTISPYYASFNRMQQQMAMYAPAKHVGKINRDETKPAPPAIIYKRPQYASRMGAGVTDDYWDVGPGSIDAIDFTSTRDMTVLGISVYGNDGNGNAVDPHTGFIRLHAESESPWVDAQPILASASFSFSTDGSSRLFDVFFDKPFDIKAGVQYSASVEYAEDDYVWFADETEDSVEVQCGEGVAVLDFSDSDYYFYDYNYTDTDDGMIPRLIVAC